MFLRAIAVKSEVNALASYSAARLHFRKPRLINRDILIWLDLGHLDLA
jgi:hypothetical protein